MNKKVSPRFLLTAKKSQGAQQVFLYIMTVVILGMIMLFGYRAISSTKERTEQVVYIKLKSDLENTIKQLGSDYGSVSIKQIEVPSKFQKICFVDNNLIDAGVAGVTGMDPDGEAYPIIDDSVQSKVRNNVFLVPDGSDALYVGRIDAEPDYFCIRITQGIVRLRLEGMGDRTRVSSYEEAIPS